jgi:hypothetical protein
VVRQDEPGGERQEALGAAPRDVGELADHEVEVAARLGRRRPTRAADVDLDGAFLVGRRGWL